MKHASRKSYWIAAACLCAAALAACGGGSSPSRGGTNPSGGTTTNSVSVIVDNGPAALVSAGMYAVNSLYATVTVCTPGSTMSCQAVDHVQVDTGSYGLSIFASVLGASVTPAPTSVSGGPLRECQQYADGYSWGSVVTLDVTIGLRTLSSLPVNLMSDPAAGTAPGSCSTGAGPAIDTVAVLGANGVMGIGYFLQDCGQGCADVAFTGLYYACPPTGCVPTTVPVTQQLQNPISALSADNNGAVIALQSATSSGQATLNGTLYFGVGTESNNSVGNAQFLTVEPTTSQTQPPATLVTMFNGSTLSGSVIDSGSNAYFFDDSALTVCTNPDYLGFYCTAASLSATLQGVNGASFSVNFDVGDANVLFDTTTPLAAFPTLAGQNGSLNNSIPGFDWGLPFFYGRSVYVLFEGGTAGSTTGPAIGF
jgi:hypothetical protein